MSAFFEQYFDNPQKPCFIVSELSCNHNGSLEEAMRLVHASKAAGADAVKMQTYTADTITRAFKNYPRGSIWEKTDLYSLYQKAYTPWDWQAKIQKEALRIGLEVLSSPFDETAVDFLQTDLDITAFKVASFEAVDIPLLIKIARTQKPVVLSTGMLFYTELVEAVTTLRAHGTKELILLHCNSGYPALFSEAHLDTIPVLRSLFNTPVGLSDHTLFAAIDPPAHPLPHVCPLEAVKRGAAMVEVHTIMDRQSSRKMMEENKGGFDWIFSRTPDELKKMIAAIRHYEKTGAFSYETEIEKSAAAAAAGWPCFEPTERELVSRKGRPSLWVVQDIKAGAPFLFGAEASRKEKGNIDTIRPDGGLHPRFAFFLESRRARYDLKAGTPLNWDMVDFAEAPPL